MSADQTYCAALDSLHNMCMTRPKEGSRWCSRHDEERKKLYAGYKSHHAKLDAFLPDNICRNTRTIKQCTSFDTVKGWSQMLRKKHKLLNRCIHARTYFTERFFGNDMDFGHKAFWHYLNKQREETEELLEQVERRAYELLLASQNASWVLEKVQDTSGQGEECGRHDDEPLEPSTQKATSGRRQTTVPDEEVEDPLDVALRQKKAEMWEKIWTRLARYCTPPQSRWYNERLAVIWTCVCRAVYMDPLLMVVAQNYRFPVSMLTDRSLDLPTVERLWKAIKGLYVHDVRSAIDDVLNPLRSGDAEYVTVLGMKIYQQLSGKRMPVHGWGHMTSVFPCYSCVRRVCKSVDDIVDLTRYAILSGGGLAQSVTRFEFEYESARALTLCGFIPNVVEDVGERNTVEKCHCPLDTKPHWTETRANNAVCAGLSLTDPKAQLFVNAALRHPNFMVLCRKGANGMLIRSKPLIGSYVRKGRTRSMLAKVPWEAPKDMQFRDSVLEEALPIVGPMQRIEECFQVVIVDSGDGSVADTIDRLVEVWYQVYGVADMRGLLACIGNPLLDDGELEVDELIIGKGFPIVPNTDEVGSAYRKMWGWEPRERPVDDEMEVERVKRVIT